MILDYVKAIVFVVLFITALYIIGNGFCKENKSFSFKFIIGYVVYNAILTVGGILIQFLNLNWFLFLLYEVLVLLTLIGYSIYKRRNIIVLLKKDFLIVFKNQWFLIAICFILLIMSVLDLPIHWLSNHLDDGYYLNRIATMPYIKDPFLTDPSTGILSSFSIIRCINVFELEASGYVFILQISPIVFVRFALTFINYFLFLQCTYQFAITLVKSLKLKIKIKYIQFFLSPIIFFGFYYEWMLDSNILILQDGWQFSTAMWYGSSVVRVSGIFLCLLPLIEHKKILIRDLVYYVLLSVCLFGKATQALPLMLLMGISYLLYMLIETKKKWSYILCASIIVVLLIIPYIITPDITINNHILNLLSMNKTSLILIGCCIVFIVSFWLKNKLVNKWNIVLIILFLLMVLPKFNSLFILASVYDFVAARTLTLFWYTFMTTNFIYFYIFLSKYLKPKRIMVFSLIVCLLISAAWGICFRASRGIKNTATIIKDNPQIYPKTMELLSYKLNDLSIKKKAPINFISPEFVMVNGYSYNICIMLRLHAPNIQSISALLRYPADADKKYIGFDVHDQELFYEFEKNPEANRSEFEKVVNEFEINGIITTNDCTTELTKLGFKLENVMPGDTDDSFQLHIYVK